MKPIVRETVETLVLAGLLFVLLRVSIQNFRVDGPSMEPSLRTGEYVFVNKLAYVRLSLGRVGELLPFGDRDEGEGVYFPMGRPQRGDVVVFKDVRGQERDLIKRVIGVEGDMIGIVNGVVYRNGQALEEPYILSALPGQEMRAQTVPPGHVFVMGDNRPASSDSRSWGPVPLEAIIGRAWVLYWPIGDAHFLGTARAYPAGQAPSSAYSR
jgi:signal peptidase I